MYNLSLEKATGTRDQSFSFILPYLGFTPSPPHFPLAQKTQENWLGKSRLFPFSPQTLRWGGARNFYFLKNGFHNDQTLHSLKNNQCFLFFPFGCARSSLGCVGFLWSSMRAQLPHSMRDLSSLTSGVLITAPPGNSQGIFTFNFDFIFIGALWAFYQYILPQVYQIVKNFCCRCRCCCCFNDQVSCSSLSDKDRNLQVSDFGKGCRGSFWNEMHLQGISRS